MRCVSGCGNVVYECCINYLLAKLRMIMRVIWGHGEQVHVEGVHMPLWDMREIELIQRIEGHAAAKLRVSTQIHEVDKYLRKAGQNLMARGNGVRKAIIKEKKWGI